MSKFKLFKHFPYSDRHEASTLSALDAFGTGGEKVALSFSISSAEDVPELEFTASSLTSNGGTIESGNIDVYVVKMWDVSGVGVHQADRMTVAELLLKDDRVPLDDGYLEHPSQGIGSSESRWLYCPPSVRLEGSATTSLPAGEAKQIWLSVKIPSNASAGNYTGHLTIAAKSGEVLQLPLSVEVLPFYLVEAEQDLLLWYRGSTDPRQGQFYISKDMLRLQMQDIFDCGFRSISVSEKERAASQFAIDTAEQVGFNRHIVLREIPFNAEELRFEKAKPVFYLSEEIDIQPPNREKTAQQLALEHKGHGAYCEMLKWNSMSSLVNHQTASRFDDDQDIGCKPTILSLSLSANKELFARRERNSIEQPSHMYYHWQCHMEKPNLNRVLAGVLLWKTGADGIAPYCYQHPPIFPFSPFDDFDAWEPFLRTGNLRDRMTTYPAQAGIIPTLQWEGLREGITDLRYLCTLDRALAVTAEIDSQSARILRQEVMKRRDTFLNRLSIAEIEIDSESATEPYSEISAHEYHEFRKQIASCISQLQAELRRVSAEKTVQL